MKVTIPGKNIKFFAKAIQPYTKIGQELFIEAKPNGLSIHGVNATKSAYAMMLFHPKFFLEYLPSPPSSDKYGNQCKVLVKSLLCAFKNVSKIVQCHIILDISKNILIIYLECKLEVIKTYHVSIMGQETLEVANVSNQIPNCISGPHKVFSDIIKNFQTNEEVTFNTSQDQIKVSNFIEGTYVNRRFMRSVIKLDPKEFTLYEIPEPTTITFCLRELRSIVNFADALNLDVLMKFQEAGMPVVFMLKHLDTFAANLIISTYSNDDDDDNDDMTYNRSVSASTKKTANKVRINDSTIYDLTSDSDLDNINTVTSDLQSNKSPNGQRIDVSGCNIRKSNVNPVENTESEEICVVFQDSEERTLKRQMEERNDIDNENETVPAKMRRQMKNIFNSCYERRYPTYPGSNSVLAEDSDSECL